MSKEKGCLGVSVLTFRASQFSDCHVANLRWSFELKIAFGSSMFSLFAFSTTNVGISSMVKLFCKIVLPHFKPCFFMPCFYGSKRK